MSFDLSTARGPSPFANCTQFQTNAAAPRPAARVVGRSALSSPVMPRKSVAALRSVDPRGRRLAPPPGLSAAEREAFIAAVMSVRPGHFAAEEAPLLTAYAAAVVEERDIARDLVAAKAAADDKAKDGLRLAHGRVSATLVRLARALRLGPLARNPSRNTRRPGTVEPSAPLPWEWEPDEPEGRLN
jgi:hypothetical protein